MNNANSIEYSLCPRLKVIETNRTPICSSSGTENEVHGRFPAVGLEYLKSAGEHPKSARAEEQQDRASL
jgi:hypothetical protein